MNDEGSKRKVNRSPEHPAFDLPASIERAEVLYEHEGFNWTSPEVAVSQWGYSTSTGRAGRTLAALKHFGLLEDTGTAKERRVRLTDLARRIIRDKREGSKERVRAIREAALSPPIYAKLWHEWGSEGDLPSHSTMAYELEHKWEFNPNAIEGFIRDFLSTIEFAGLESADTVEEETPGEAETTTPRELVRETSDGNSTAHGSVSKHEPRFDLPIPLLGGRRAVLSIPTPLSEQDYEILKETLDASLAVMKRALVAGSVEGES